jgi:hypothetical protein
MGMVFCANATLHLMVGARRGNPNRGRALVHSLLGWGPVRTKVLRGKGLSPKIKEGYPTWS